MTKDVEPSLTAVHPVDDQSRVLAFLGDPASHGGAPVRRIDTHGAVVFLAGELAYKLKRAVWFPFMDFSTLAKRRAACMNEIAVNRPNAPDIYLDCLEIRDDGSRISFGGSGEAIDYVVKMKRFDDERALDRIASSGGLTPAIVAALAETVLASHERAPRRDGAGTVAALGRIIGQNAEALAEMPELFPALLAERIGYASRVYLRKLRPLLLARGGAGFVRRGHGDLHLRNIVLLGDRPTLVDAIEFDDAIATGDILYDLSFLLMDLWHRGFPGEANVILNSYLARSDAANLEGVAALPLFISLRATIRAKVDAAGLRHLAESERAEATSDVRAYFDLAVAALTPAEPVLVAVGGLSGTGKSTLAAAIAPALDRVPGAVHLRSDIERKRMMGVAPTARLGPEGYTAEATEAVYARLRAMTATALAAGRSVVVDAVHARPAERDAIAAVAAEAGVPFTGLWLEASQPVLIDRVTKRVGDASDADAAVVRSQAGYDIGAIDWIRLDAAADGTSTADAALVALGVARP